MYFVIDDKNYFSLKIKISDKYFHYKYKYFIIKNISHHMVGVAIFGANFLVTKNSFVKKNLMIKYPITKSFFCVKFIISDEI